MSRKVRQARRLPYVEPDSVQGFKARKTVSGKSHPNSELASSQATPVQRVLIKQEGYSPWRA